jgi:exodeoxyribonuclease VII small subunit
MMEPASQPYTLEKRIERLEQIAASLEGDRLELDQALQLFEEGIRHLREAERLLTESELRIDRILDEIGGTLITEPVREEPA